MVTTMGPSDSGGYVGTPAGFQRRWITLAMMLAIVGLGACEKQEAPPPPPRRMVLVFQVHLKAAELGGQASGVIDSRYSAQVGFLVGGRLINRSVDVGSIVKKGDVLAQLDPTDYQNKLTAAQSQVSAAES